MGTYVGRLRERRVQLQAEEVARERVGGARPEAVQQAKDAFGQSLAPGKAGAGGAGKWPLRVYAEVYERGDALHLSTALLAKHVTSFANDLAAMDRLQAAWNDLPLARRHALEGLTGRVFQGLSGVLDAGTASRALGTLRTLAAHAEALHGGHVGAHEALARAASAFGAETGEAFDGGSRVLAAEGRPERLGPAMAALGPRADELAKLWPVAGRARAFTVAVELALQGAVPGEAEPAVQVDEAARREGWALSDEQRRLLTELVSGSRLRATQVAQRGQALAGALQAEAARSQRTFAAKPAREAEALATLRAEADRALAPDQRLAWHQALNASAAQTGEILLALGRLYTDVLSRAGEPAPAAPHLQAMGNALLQLAAQAQVPVTELSPLAHGLAALLPADRMPGAFAVTTAILGAVRRAHQPLPEVRSIEAVAEALAPQMEAFVAANGPQRLLVEAMSRPGPAKVRALAAREGAPFALALSKAEPGPARDLETASFAQDFEALARAQLSPRSIAARSPALPADALPRLLAVGLEHRYPVEDWLSELTAAFAFVSRSKEAVRDLRSLLLLADQGGGDPRQLLKALLAAKDNTLRRDRDFNRVVTALLHENNLVVSQPQIRRAVKALERGEDLAGKIEHQLHAAMVENLGLQALLQDAQLRPTDHGLNVATTDLVQFFSLAANNLAQDGKNLGTLYSTRNGATVREPSPGIDRDLLKSLLISVLEDHSSGFRFTTPAAKSQLESLSDAQRRGWQISQTMNHVRFDAAGQEVFDDRVTFAAKMGKAIQARLTDVWGALDTLQARHREDVEALRRLDKNDVPARRELGSKAAWDARKVEALAWAHEMAALTSDTTTPLQFAKLAAPLRRVREAIGEPAYDALLWSVKIDDLAFSEVVTSDGPDLGTLYQLATSNCLKGWPNQPDALAYMSDANKRMIVTTSAAGEQRRAMMRLVERQDRGHVGEPMLVLERTYPDNASEEEKQRIIEHMLRRATEMGIPAAYPLEYYWDSSQTQRRILDMNDVIEDLNRRYHTTAQEKTLKVKNRAGNVAAEYIDSAPPTGAAGAGVVGMRHYPGQEDTIYENTFMVLKPKKG